MIRLALSVRATIIANAVGLLLATALLAGFTIDAVHGLGALRGAGIVIVPSWHDSGTPASPALLQALRAAHRRGATIVGLCLGAFLLAEAGLLDARPATTHWQWVASFSQRYPAVRLQPDVLYVDDGQLLTSAGTFNTYVRDLFLTDIPASVGGARPSSET